MSKESTNQQVKKVQDKYINSHSYLNNDIVNATSINLSYQEDLGNIELSVIDMIDRLKGTERINYVNKIVKENISLDILLKKHSFPNEQKSINEIARIIAEVIAFGRGEITIEGFSYPCEYVKEKFLQLEFEHIEYLLESLERSNRRINNVRQYLITSLFNALDTISINYKVEAQIDILDTKFGR